MTLEASKASHPALTTTTSAFAAGQSGQQQPPQHHHQGSNGQGAAVGHPAATADQQHPQQQQQPPPPLQTGRNGRRTFERVTPINNSNGDNLNNNDNNDGEPTSPLRSASAGSKMMAVRVQMLDDSITLFQIQVKYTFPLSQQMLALDKYTTTKQTFYCVRCIAALRACRILKQYCSIFLSEDTNWPFPIRSLWLSRIVFIEQKNFRLNNFFVERQM